MFFVYDGSHILLEKQGSERAIITGTQTVQGAIVYDAFGNPVSASGTSTDPFQWGATSGYSAQPGARVMPEWNSRRTTGWRTCICTRKRGRQASGRATQHWVPRAATRWPMRTWPRRISGRDTWRTRTSNGSVCQGQSKIPQIAE